MDVEFTARQVKITKALRTQAEVGFERIARILGRTAHASVTFGEQRHLQIVEITVHARTQVIAATGNADTLSAALRLALDHAEHQSQRYRDRKLTKKRLPTREKVPSEDSVSRIRTRASHLEAAEKNGKPLRAARQPVALVHSEPHIRKGVDAVAAGSMTVEEAVKDVEARDRDLLIFRNAGGDLHVLHRNRNGQIELIELP